MARVNSISAVREAPPTSTRFVGGTARDSPRPMDSHRAGTDGPPSHPPRRPSPATATDGLHPDVGRPVHINPGDIDVAKLSLASTKNHAHRVYIADGIYGEVTLRIGDGQWQTWPWTYPDYQKPRAQEWFMRVRERLRAQHAAGESLSGGGPRA